MKFHKFLLFPFLLFSFACANESKPSFPRSFNWNDRVSFAKFEKEAYLIDLLKKKNIDYLKCYIYWRAFKREQRLELWARNKTNSKFQKIKTYPFCTMSGGLGPKRKEGDRQIPEGIYRINHFNPKSNYYLSLGLNYPNDSDKVLSDPSQPGSDIYIHGNCVSIGCIAITDDKIKEAYTISTQVRQNGQSMIRLDIFPYDFSIGLSPNEKQLHGKNLSFWKNLEMINASFDKSQELRKVSVRDNGLYQLN